MANKGYLLPDNIDPNDDICLVVHIPNDPAYRRAFWGQYEELGYWWIWERDELKQGRDAAARMRESILRTHELYDEIGDWCDMDITINNNQQCCDQALSIVVNTQLHVDTGTIDEILALPGGTTDDGTNPPTQDWIDYNDYQVDKCDAAYQLASDLQSTIGNLAAFGGGIAALSASAQTAMITAGTTSGLVAGLMAVGLSLSAALSILMGFLFAVVGLGTFAMGYFANLYNQLNFQDLVCAFYDAADEATALANVQDLVDGWGQDAAIGALTKGNIFLDMFQEIIDLLLAPELLAALFGFTEYVNTLVGGNCVSCAGVVAPNDYGVWYQNEGSLAGDTPSGPYWFTTAPLSGCHRIRVFFNHDGTGYLTSDLATLLSATLISGTGIQCSSVERIRVMNQAGTITDTFTSLSDIPAGGVPAANVLLFFDGGSPTQKVELDWTM